MLTDAINEAEQAGFNDPANGFYELFMCALDMSNDLDNSNSSNSRSINSNSKSHRDDSSYHMADVSYSVKEIGAGIFLRKSIHKEGSVRWYEMDLEVIEAFNVIYKVCQLISYMTRIHT